MAHKSIPLKEAIARGKLKQFVKDRENEPPADKERFDACLLKARFISRKLLGKLLQSNVFHNLPFHYKNRLA